MIRDLGIVQPGTTLYIPFHTFDSNDPSASVTMTGLATTDIEIYKDGSTTQRASDAGYALLDTDGIDFDTITGIHGISINLADNTTAGFYAAGSQYWVVVSSITVDAATINFVLCTFHIGYEGAVLNTTIATLSSQTSFTLTAGPAEDDALNNCQIVIHDVASAVQVGRAVILDYTGSTKTVTLAAGTTFTAAASDNVAVLGLAPLIPTTAGRTLDVSTGGEAGVDWANVGTPGSTVSLSATTVAAVTTTTTATNVTTVNGLAANVITATAIQNDAITAAKIAAGAIDAATFAADVDAEILSYIVDDATRIDASALNTASVTTIPAILVDTAEIGAAGAGLTVLATAAELAKVPKSDGTATWNATALASIQTEANDAIVANRLDELLAADSDIDGAAPPTVGSVFHELMTKTAGSFTYDQTTDSLEAVRDRGDAAWITATGFSTLDAAGVRAAVGLASANLDTQLGDLPTNAELATSQASADDATLAAIAALNNLSAAQVNAEVDTALADYDAPTNAEMVARTLASASYATATALQTVDDELAAVAVQLVDILSLVESIAITGSATYTAAASSTLTTGSLSSGTYESTATADGVSHVHTDTGGAIEVMYQFELGASEVGVEVLFRGRVNSGNDTILVQAYDWVGADWETLWSQVGVGGSVDTNRAEPLLTKYTGTGANDGDVRIRFYAASGLSSATLYVDQLLVGKTVTTAAMATAVWANATRTLTSLSGLTVDTVTTLTNLPTIPANWITAAGIADGAIDTATFASGATLPRVTLVDTTTTNTDMRGTDNAALAATALSTAQWTNTLATNLGTTNTTVASNLDAAVSSRSTYAGGAVASVTGNVGGNVTGSVGSVLGGINTTGGTITTLDALDTAQDTQHSTTQGLVTTVDTVVDAIKVKTDLLPTDPADQSAVEAAITASTSPLATQASVNTIDDFLDTEIAAIKAKTDSLTFTVAGQVDANIQYVNDTQVDGTGATGDEWGPV